MITKEDLMKLSKERLAELCVELLNERYTVTTVNPQNDWWMHHPYVVTCDTSNRNELSNIKTK